MSASERGLPAEDRDRSVLVVGIGNRYRGDDAVGLAVASRVRRTSPAGVRVIDLEDEPLSLLDEFEGSAVVFVVDAVASGRPAGNVHRFDAVEEPPPAPFHHRGTHAFSLAEVVELARALGRLPDRLTVYGVEGASFATGAGLSPEAERGARVVADRVLLEIAGARTGGER